MIWYNYCVLNKSGENMLSFGKSEKDLKLPLGPVWLMNAIAEYKGKQELYEKQSPQVLKSIFSWDNTFRLQRI